MNKNITRSLLAAGLAMIAINGMAENRLYLENFSIKPGEVKEVLLNLDTEETAMNCQFELVLPAGLSYDDNETTDRSENCPYTTSTGKQKTTVMQVQDNPTVCKGDGVTPCIRFVLTNGQNAPFEGLSGPIVVLYIAADEDYVESAPIELRDVIVGHSSSEKLIDYATFTSKSYLKVPLAETANYNGKEIAIEEPMGVAIISGDKAFVTDGNENWMQVRLDDAIAEEASAITTFEEGAIMGVFNGGTNPYMTAVETPVQAEDDVEINIKSYDLASDLFAPKANEVLIVTGFYQGDKLTGYSGDNGGLGQEVTLKNEWCAGDVPELTAKGQYKFSNAVAQLIEPWEVADPSGAPARINTNDADAARNVEIYPLTYPDVMTAVADINVSKNVASVKYYNAAGVASDSAFEGVNIVVTKYADGSQSISKVVK